MQTHFTPEQLRDSGTAVANNILRKCVHCGFCTATCPTYQVLGDELDSPRGRIYLMKAMLETGRKPDARTVKHIDRCLSCLSCMTTCPSGVHYMHLVDHARAYIEKHYQRPLADRWMRAMLGVVLPNPSLFRLALLGARLARPFRRLLPRRLRAMIDLAPRQIAPPHPSEFPGIHAAQGVPRMRVALMTGCAQKALNPEINAATIRLLTRLGAEVIVAKGSGCCGALTHHMGKVEASHRAAAANIRAWKALGALDAIVINTSGCGTTVKDYGHMFRDDPTLAADAAAIAGLARDVTEVIAQLGLGALKAKRPQRIIYHAACSLQHGQRLRELPKELLRAAGHTVLEPAEAHLCCGSAGTYNLLQPEIAGQLGERKVKNLLATGGEVIVAGNIGCMMQIGSRTQLPVKHIVQVLEEGA